MTILCYHSVQPGWNSPLAVEPPDFAAHCAALARRRRVVPLGEAIPRLDRSGRLPRGLAALTFDDGFAALYDHALPVLARLRLPATVFLVAQTLTAGGQDVDWVDTPGTEPLRTLSLDQVLEMQEAGVDFQSHSYAHRTLTTLTFDECVQDLRASRELLSDLLGHEVTQLAYPRGRHDARVRAATAAAGYTDAFALPEGSEEPGAYAIPRVGVFRGNSTAALCCKTMRSYLPVRLHPGYPAAHRAVRTARTSLRRMSEPARRRR